MLPVIQVGPIAMQTSGLVLLIGVWLGLSLAERYCTLFGIQASSLYNLVFITIIAGSVGARLSYAIRYPGAFAANPASLISPNLALFDPLGGLLAGMIAALIYGQRKKLPLASALDSLTPVLAVMSVAAGVAHLASGSAFGAPSNLPWTMHLWGEARHPSQLYEILAASIILTFFWPGRRLFRYWVPGAYFCAFIGASAFATLFLQAFRGDSVLVLNGFRLNQVIAWVILAASMLIFNRLSRLSRKEDVETDIAEQ